MSFVKVFKTSKGIFKTRDDAILNKNRAKINDPRDPEFGFREPVVEAYAIRFIDGDGKEKFFSLTEIQVN